MDKGFKPLWLINNRVYRQYAKGITMKNFKKYSKKILKVLKIKK